MLISPSHLVTSSAPLGCKAVCFWRQYGRYKPLADDEAWWQQQQISRRKARLTPSLGSKSWTGTSNTPPRDLSFLFSIRDTCS